MNPLTNPSLVTNAPGAAVGASTSQCTVESLLATAAEMEARRRDLDRSMAALCEGPCSCCGRRMSLTREDYGREVLRVCRCTWEELKKLPRQPAVCGYAPLGALAIGLLDDAPDLLLFVDGVTFMQTPKSVDWKQGFML